MGVSVAAVLAGVWILFGLVVLWASHDLDDLRIQLVTRYYKASWTPGTFWPTSVVEHAQKDQSSPLFGAVWAFLFCWLASTGLYLILAGSITTIEVFREEAHLRAAECVCAALCLCGAWPALFRRGISNDHNEYRWAGVFLWLACSATTLAAILATAGSAWLKAWALPGPQYGPLFY